MFFNYYIHFLHSTIWKQTFIVLTYRKCWHIANPIYFMVFGFTRQNSNKFGSTLIGTIIRPDRMLKKSCNRLIFLTKAAPQQSKQAWSYSICTFFVPFVEYVIRYFNTGTELFKGDALRHCFRLVLEIELFHTFSHYGKVQASLLCSWLIENIPNLRCCT